LPFGPERHITSDATEELKLDGYRAQAIRDGASVRLFSRRGKDLTQKYPLVSRGLLDAIKFGTAPDELSFMLSRMQPPEHTLSFSLSTFS